MPDMLDREKVLKLLKQRRNFLFKVYEQNKNSIAAAHHLEALETTEEIYEMIAEMPYEKLKPEPPVLMNDLGIF